MFARHCSIPNILTPCHIQPTETQQQNSLGIPTTHFRWFCPSNPHLTHHPESNHNNSLLKIFKKNINQPNRRLPFLATRKTPKHHHFSRCWTPKKHSKEPKNTTKETPKKKNHLDSKDSRMLSLQGSLGLLLASNSSLPPRPCWAPPYCGSWWSSVPPAAPPDGGRWFFFGFR